MRGGRWNPEPASVPPEVPAEVEQEAVKIAVASEKIPARYEGRDAVRVSCAVCPFKTEVYASVDIAEAELAEHMAAAHRNDIGRSLEAKGGAPWCGYCQAPSSPTRDGKHGCQCRMEAM